MMTPKTFSAALLTAALALAACDRVNPVLPLSEVRDFTVTDLKAACDGSTPVLQVELDVDGYTQRDVREGDSFVGSGPARLPGSDLSLAVRLSVERDAVPSGGTHTVQIETPMERAGYTPGTSPTIDVRNAVESGVPPELYEAVVLPLPTCP